MGLGKDVFNILFDKMSVAVVIIGIGEWEKYTEPCIESIRACEPKVDIIVVDNGSEPIYPTSEHAYICRLGHTMCYAAAMNVGIDLAEERKHDWILLCNNDVLFSKPFVEFIEMQHPRIIFGFYNHELKGREYVSAWAMFFNKYVWTKIGMFDETFKPMGYEDADYSFRAVDKGFKLCELSRKWFGIEHIKRDRPKLPVENLKLLKEKHDL